jgi:hypothetical protein
MAFGSPPAARAGSEEANCRFLHLRWYRPCSFWISASWFHVDNEPAAKRVSRAAAASEQWASKAKMTMHGARDCCVEGLPCFFSGFPFSQARPVSGLFLSSSSQRPGSLSLDGRAGSEGAPCFDGQAEATRDGRACIMHAACTHREVGEWATHIFLSRKRVSEWGGADRTRSRSTVGVDDDLQLIEVILTLSQTGRHVVVDKESDIGQFFDWSAQR